MISLIKAIHTHTDKVWSVSCHATLPLLASASSDKTCRLYKLAEPFQTLATLADTHKRSMRAVSFKLPLTSGDAKFLDLPALACGSFDSTVSVWGIDEPEDMEEQMEAQLDADPEVDGDEQNMLGQAERAQKELLTSAKNEWNLMALIEGHENEVKAVAWNWSGRYLASCSRDKTVWIWETDPETLEDFECVSVLSDHDQDIKHIVFHPQLNLLASSSYDDTVRLYSQDPDDEDWSCVACLNGHKGTVWCSAFEHPASASAAPGRVRLVSASDDTTVRVWATTDARESAPLSSALPSSIKHTSSAQEWVLELQLPPVHTLAVYFVSWSRTSGRLASVGADGQIAVYTEKDGAWHVVCTLNGAHGVYEVNCVTWCIMATDEEVLATCGDDGHVNIWRVGG